MQTKMCIHEYYQINFYNIKEQLIFIQKLSYSLTATKYCLSIINNQQGTEVKLEKVAMVFCFYFHI